MHNETTRKIVHVGLAFIFAALAPLVTMATVAALGGLLFIVFALARLVGAFHVLRRVGRTTYGDLFFATGIVVAAVAFLPTHISAFQTGLLVLGVADSLAALIGRTWGHVRYVVRGEHRSLEGSLACVATALGILLVYGVAPVPAVAGALVLAAIEALAPLGSDNVLLPLAAGALVLFVV